MGDFSGQPFVLLLKVMQSNGGFNHRAMSQMLHKVAGLVPKEVVIMNDQEVMMELKEETSMMQVLRAIHWLFNWGGQSISVDSVVAKKHLVTEIVRECEGS